MEWRTSLFKTRRENKNGKEERWTRSWNSATNLVQQQLLYANKKKHLEDANIYLDE